MQRGPSQLQEEEWTVTLANASDDYKTFMFSLTGIPPTAGFMGKFYIFMSAINAGYTWLVIIAVIFSAIRAFI